MGRHSSSGSTDHGVQRFGRDAYRISWTVDRYYSGSRLRFPTTYSRDTDRAGALRFVKKWAITWRVPKELTS